LWLMACDVRLFQRLKIMLGDAIVQVGKQTVYQGGDVIPAMVKPRQALRELIRSAIKAKFIKRWVRLMLLEFIVNGLPLYQVTNTDKRDLKKMGVIDQKGGV
jgi:hypothetical protein